MKNAVFFLACLLAGANLFSQDAYHQSLQDLFQTEYNLPVGEWVFFDNESQNMNAAGGYGGSYSILESAGTAFSKKARAVIADPGDNPWNSGWNIRNQRSITRGDKVLILFSIRSPSGSGKVTIFAENSTTFSKEAALTVEFSDGWTQYLVPFESSQTFNVNTITFGFHLAFQAQTLEIGGFTAINFGDDVSLASLPSQLNNDKYDGYQTDAPWRAAAAERIENIRKADLNIEVKTPEGTPVNGAIVQVKMLRHEFAFGSAITANRLAGNNKYNAIYENKITDLDGRGHGFNWVVFENDLKWPGWEDEWLVNHAELVKAVKWLRDRNIEIRGHTLVWPGANNLPQDINANSGNLPYIKERIDGHLNEILNYPGLKGEIIEWDVLNEITTNRSLEEYFRGSPGYNTGREILAEIFKKTREIDANTGLWLNDYVTLSSNTKPGNQNYDNLKLFIRELIDAGVDIEGLGFQGHIGGFPNGIPSVLETLDDFYKEFGLKAKITEFDLPTFIDEELAAQYLRDFLTAIFSHESMNGFMFWSFWDGATYMNEGSNLFRLDWSRTPACEAFTDLLFNEWRTEETLETSSDGQIQTRVFKGLYEVSYESNGQTMRDTINISEATELEIVAGNIATEVEREVLAEQNVLVYPNPAYNRFYIRKFTPEVATIRLFDLTGRKVLEQKTEAAETSLSVNHLSGVFSLEITTSGGNTFVKKVLIR